MYFTYRCTIWFLSLLFQQYQSSWRQHILYWLLCFGSPQDSQGAQLRSRVGYPNIESADPVEDCRKGWSPRHSKLLSMDLFAFEHLKWFTLVLISLHAQILLLHWKSAMTIWQLIHFHTLLKMPAGCCSLDSSKLGWIETSAFHQSSQSCCQS